jgi:pyrimidine operon attenuation protein/uracil phosphoribosyltransferase
MDSQPTQILGARELDTKIHRLAFQILENHPRSEFTLVGIHRRGVPLARRLARVLETDRPDIPVGTLDITLYHDDPDNVDVSATMARTHIPGPVAGHHLILVDDVLYTGRTIRAAIDAVLDIGRPSRIELAVLVDRGHRELPIQPDYCGLLRPTGPDEYLRVLLREEDGQDGLHLVNRKDARP